MSEAVTCVDLIDPTPTDWQRPGDAARASAAAMRAERRFRLLGLVAVLLSAGFLAFLLITMIGNGLRGFTQTEVRLDVDFPRSVAVPRSGGAARLRRRAGARQCGFRTGRR